MVYLVKNSRIPLTKDSSLILDKNTFRKFIYEALKPSVVSDGILELNDFYLSCLHKGRIF